MFSSLETFCSSCQPAADVGTCLMFIGWTRIWFDVLVSELQVLQSRLFVVFFQLYMWLFNSHHLPVSLAGFRVSPLSPSDYSEGVRRNRELNLSSAWMHRSHLKFCGLGKFTWRLCPIILSLAIWTMWASRMVSPVSERTPLPPCQFTELLHRPNRFLASKDVYHSDSAASFCHAAEREI